MAIPFAKSGYSTEVSGYVDNPIPKRCDTCEYFKKPNLCNNKIVAGDDALFCDPSSGLKLVSPQFGCCNEWEPAAKQPLNLVYVVRHGETKLNASNSFRGNVDVDLDAKGITQAEEARAFLSGIPFRRFISSAKERAMHTMEIIIGDCSFETSPDLMALDVGDFSGKPKNKENLKALKYYIDHPSITIPGGESLKHFQERVRPILKACIREALDCKAPVLILGHSSIVHEIGSMLKRDPQADLVHPGGVAVIFRLPSGKLDSRAILHPHKASGSDVVS